MIEGVWITSKIIFTRSGFGSQCSNESHRNDELEIFLPPTAAESGSTYNGPQFAELMVILQIQFETQFVNWFTSSQSPKNGAGSHEKSRRNLK